MDVLLNIVNYILGFGAAVFVPLIMLIIGLIVKMSFKDAFFAALTLGIAFTGMNVLINFMTGAITPAAQGLAEATGISLPAVDVGWPALSAIAWAWPLGVLCFPLLMVINLIMLLLKLTDTLNVDFWNCWTKLLTTVLTYYLCAAAGMPEGVAIAMGFVAASVQIILELKIGDAFQPTIERITGIPGVTVPHAMMLTATVAYPIERLLEKIPAIENNNADAKWLRKKIGIFGENAVMGFIIGTAMGAIAYRDVQQALTLGVQAATALQLFPMVSKLFMQALSPISDAVGDFMKARFKGRELIIGLDWPILAGSNELWVTCILLIPFELILAFVLAPVGNIVLPFAGIVNICLVPGLLMVSNGNIIKMLIEGIIITPVYLLVSSSFAPWVTQLALTYSPDSLANVGGDALISWSTLECPDFRWAIANAFSGNVAGMVVLVGWLALFVWMLRGFKKRNEALKASE
ncbi:MAG: PTS galactitol transporter subunit IIC [Atopobiaceae bacterium]|jgi:PTS system galactitol-specific IIC component|uniref:PTS galactitol transporter subunit IIC n=1 Tax=Muricaecibacterium torontonense TaxID=3032871 RepID=A0A4S2F2B6_9ACTN|nr:PTS transporter subunit IIC [Muricaecibacterium torontonense]MCI8675300.1 PTS galactitol transporter subunit IIC [Atopobiaceae bacterium]TGY63086.1 PTS galactitol transporter subunit IIC [Muricaecibacterium torontonense]